MGVHHDMVAGSLADREQVMVDQGLAVVVLPVRDDIAYVAAFDGIVAILVHQSVGLLHPPFIINSG